MTMPISSPTNAAGVNANAAAPAAPAATGMAGLLQGSTFLNLLVDELKYQDPLNPASSSSFMNQIAQLSQVEQLQTVSSSSQISEAASLLGKTVTGADTNGTQITGVVTGVTNGANGPTLNVGTNVITLSAVTNIDVAAGSSGASSPTTSGTASSSTPTTSTSTSSTSTTA
ncbi:MAG: flagellar hook capping FlgD N-terminal domain-containing protein [Acidimicrobiales bacterium]